MDRAQEELQFLGFFGILKESLKIIYSWRKIISQITLAFIFPLSFFLLARVLISYLLLKKFLLGEHTPIRTPKSASLFAVISYERAAFLLFNVAYYILINVFSLVSCSAVVFTIACIYTAKGISFKKVMSVVPKVWKRLIVTFLWSLSIIFAYNLVAIAVVALLLLLFVFLGHATIGVIIFCFWLIFYSAGLTYIYLVWDLAIIVSVLEDVYGFKALTKSRTLIKGKVGVAMIIFLLFFFGRFGIEILFDDGAMAGIFSQSVGIKIMIGILCFSLLFVVILFNIVIETVLYFVCKSYHHENIDKSSLADQLDVYQYVPLKPRPIVFF